MENKLVIIAPDSFKGTLSASQVCEAIEKGIKLSLIHISNVEMRNAVGRDNIYIFGLDAHEVDEIWKAGYDSGVYYRKSQALAGVMNTLRGGFAGSRFSNLVNYFMYSHGISDPYMCFADFESYMNVSSKIRADYENKICLLYTSRCV